MTYRAIHEWLRFYTPSFFVDIFLSVTCVSCPIGCCVSRHNKYGSPSLTCMFPISSHILHEARSPKLLLGGILASLRGLVLTGPGQRMRREELRSYSGVFITHYRGKYGRRNCPSIVWRQLSFACTRSQHRHLECTTHPPSLPRLLFRRCLQWRSVKKTAVVLLGNLQPPHCWTRTSYCLPFGTSAGTSDAICVIPM